MTKTLVSTSYKPVETCDLQPQTHCTIVTKPVPLLKVVPNCYTEEKEVCRRKQGDPKPTAKEVLVKWCRRADDKAISKIVSPPEAEYLPSYGELPEFTISELNARTNSKK